MILMRALPLFFLFSTFAFPVAWAADITSLEECIKIGMEHYTPLKLADEEVELARLKKEEAYRSFYPAVSAKAEETTGETQDPTRSPEFTERSYGVSLTQSFFEGGKVFSTYKQAVASHLAAEKSRERTWQDFVFNVREAYWKLVAAEHSYSERETVRDAIKADLKVMTEQYVLDLAVKQQFLSVKSQYLQANTQANAARAALARSKWNLAKALGLTTPPTFSVTKDIPFKKIEVDLNQALLLATSHRPDLKMQDHLVDVAKRGRQVATSARWPKLNVNSFYGRSASAFDTDPLTYREDWQVNARLSQSFWGNSLGLTNSRIDTSPRLGQSTRTNTETKGVQLNVLDGMRDRTEMKQSDLMQRQAELKRDDLKIEVAMDIEEAVTNVSQALLQVEFNEEDVKLAEEELRVAESKGKYGLSSVLELAQARNRAATSRSVRMDGLAAYQISVAALNRAVGIVDQYQAK